jgi:geranylgeranyl reductase family protein
MAALHLKTNVIIVGAGPAGAGTSFFLSKAGIAHIVLDKALFPRDKVCGDACSGKTALVINRANPQWLAEILQDETNFMPSWGIKFVAPNGKDLDIPFNLNRTPESKAPGFTVPRLNFDNFLFTKMQSPHCTVYQEAHIQSIHRIAPDSVQLNFTQHDISYQITAPLIVAADGDKSMVRRALFNVPTTLKSYAVGLRAYYRGITDMHPENFIELHFLKELLPGYLWIFPLPDGKANVGVGILSDVVRKKNINLRQKMLEAIASNPNLSKRFKEAQLINHIQGWGLPMAEGNEKVSTHNLLLCGDAASLIDPFSGEGIGNALYSGMLAADAMAKSLEQNNYSEDFLQANYDNVLHKRLGDEFRISQTLQHLCRYSLLFNLVVNKARKSPVLKDTISSMFTNMDLRGILSKPSFYFKILFNKK